MTVISIPNRLRASAALLLLSIPLIALEIIIATRSPLWRLPLRSMGYWSLSFGLICIPLSIWLVSAKKWAFKVTFLLSLLWILASTWATFTTRCPSLGFFTLFLLVYLIVELSWLKTELERSFFDPQLAWYQGLPKPIPGIKCQLSTDDKTLDLRVSRIDLDGVFLFLDSDEPKTLVFLSTFFERRKTGLTLSFKDRQITCEGAPTLTLPTGKGVGMQFLNSSPDLRKEIGDFVEILRGQGYA